MPIFRFHLRRRKTIDPDDHGIEFRDFEQAYLEACQAIPDVARDLLVQGVDPITCAYVICDEQGRYLADVPFTEVLPPSKWRLRRARRRPHSGLRSERARNDLALSSFRRIFASANVGGVLLTPELLVREITEFGAKHSHVDPDAVRNTSILDIFVDLKGKPKQDFTKFMTLAQASAVSEVVDLPYLVLNEAGETANGWWNARTWPIFDDDDHLLGLVEWATPFEKPTSGGATLVRVAPPASGLSD